MSIYFEIGPAPVAEKLGKQTFWLGLALLIIGAIGIFLPEFLALTINYFLAWLLILAAVFMGYLTWITPYRDLSSWLKSILLLAVGILLFVFPEAGVATLTLLLALYFIMDAAINFALAKQIYPMKGWGWMVFNGIITFLLALLAAWGWPQTSGIFLGVIVGVSLLLDGVVFTRVGWELKKKHRVELE